MAKKKAAKVEEKKAEKVTFEKPTKVSDIDVTFPARALEIMPAYEEIPEEFKHGSTPWNKLFSTWFYRGLDGYFETVEGVDLSDAMRHLKVVMGSYAPKHEHKEAAAAYLMSRWFTQFVMQAKKEEAQP